jgi:hypothetical protein
MARAALMVYSRPSDPAREDEYNAWYDGTHMPEVLATPGFVGGRRFRVSPHQPAGGPGALPEYLAIYEIDSDDPGKAVDEMLARVGRGEIGMSDVLQLDPPPSTALYEACR